MSASEPAKHSLPPGFAQVETKIYVIAHEVPPKPVNQSTAKPSKHVFAHQLLRGNNSVAALKPVSNNLNETDLGVKAANNNERAVTSNNHNELNNVETNNDGPVETIRLQRLPAPFDGAIGWAKFLKDNIIYPEKARQSGITGKVWLSFVVERDGSITGIAVEKPAGNGFDEEAVRVLKLASAWLPGIQNGQPVRAKYSLPITFQFKP